MIMFRKVKPSVSQQRFKKLVDWKYVSLGYLLVDCKYVSYAIYKMKA